MTKFESGFIRRFACLNGPVLTIDEEFYFRKEADDREDRYAVAVYGDTQSSTCMYSAWTPSLSNFARILHVHGA